MKLLDLNSDLDMIKKIDWQFDTIFFFSWSKTLDTIYQLIFSRNKLAFRSVYPIYMSVCMWSEFD